MMWKEMDDVLASWAKDFAFIKEKLANQDRKMAEMEVKLSQLSIQVPVPVMKPKGRLRV